MFADPSWHHEYRESLIGNKSFREASDRLFFGEKSAVVHNKRWLYPSDLLYMHSLLIPREPFRVVCMQTLGASGACHSAAVLLRDHYAPWKSKPPRVYIPEESWGKILKPMCYGM